MNKIIAIVGPTATGKTDLAISLCKKFNGEIISVDSRQAYKEMNIGTGKGPIENGQLRIDKLGVPIHLYDLVNPDERLNAYDYSLLVQQKIEEIWSRENLPFLVGGTGFYMDVILGRRILAGVKADLKLREGLEALHTGKLVETINKLDPQKAGTIDTKNRYRLIRAIELSSSSVILSKAKDLPARSAFSPADAGGDSSGRTPQNDGQEMVKYGLGDILIIGLTGENSYLYTRGDARVNEMINEGLADEVRGLAKKYGWEAPGLNALGYREFKSYLEGSIQLDESVRKLKYDTHAYIRRQKTYFKKYFNDALWFDVSQKGFGEQAAGEVELFLR